MIVPFSVSGTTILISCLSAMLLAIARPSPVPPGFDGPSVFQNRSKILSLSTCRIPGPKSRTSITPSFWVSSTVPPSGENFTALSRTASSICRSTRSFCTRQRARTCGQHIQWQRGHHLRYAGTRRRPGRLFRCIPCRRFRHGYGFGGTLRHLGRRVSECRLYSVLSPVAHRHHHG